MLRTRSVPPRLIAVSRRGIIVRPGLRERKRKNESTGGHRKQREGHDMGTPAVRTSKVAPPD